jgi:DNA-binding beta-propeller fold protein YncE
VIDGTIGTLSATIPTVALPQSIAVTSDGSLVFVNGQFFDAAAIRTNDHSSSVLRNVGGGIVATNPRGNLVYLGNVVFGRVLVIDQASQAAVGTIPLGLVDGASIAPDGRTAYLSRNPLRELLVIDLETASVTERLDIVRAGGVAVALDGSFVYVTDSVAFPGFESREVGVVTVVDTATNEIVRTVRAGIGSSGIAVTFNPIGDANCDTRVGAADLLAICRLTSAGQRATCRLDDADRDCTLSSRDLHMTVAAIFRP